MGIKRNGKSKDEGNILEITKYEQYRTVDELFMKGRSSSSYYTLLGLAAIITTSGLLLDSIAIVIGGMLVAPVLTPLLLIGLGLSLGQFAVIKRVGYLMIRSFGLVIVISAALAIAFGQPTEVSMFAEGNHIVILYFLVALSSGIAGTFALARKELTVLLPGVAVAITLLPPISLMGIWASALNFDLVRFYFVIFLLNVFGIVAGSLAVFSLLGFYRLKKKVKVEEEKVEVAEEKKKQEKQKTKEKKVVV